MFKPSKIHQADYKQAAAAIQRNFDEISKLLLPATKPFSTDKKTLDLLIDNNTLGVDGDGRLYVKGVKDFPNPPNNIIYVGLDERGNSSAYTDSLDETGDPSSYVDSLQE
jgi:hypothetical protein